MTIKRNNFNLKKYNLPMSLVKIKVKSLGIRTPVELKKFILKPKKRFKISSSRSSDLQPTVNK